MENEYLVPEENQAEEIEIPKDDLNIRDILSGPRDVWAWENYYDIHDQLDLMSAWAQKYFK